MAKFNMMVWLACLGVLFNPALAQKKLVYIALDASDSMNGLWDGATKWEKSESSLKNLAKSAPPETMLGVVVFGGEAGCERVRTAIVAKKHNRSRIRMGLRKEQPAGSAPLHLALKRLADMMPTDVTAADWVVITDGGPFCGSDMLAEVKQYKASFPGLRIHVIGLNLNESLGRLASLVEVSGGMGFNVANEQQLAMALQILTETHPGPEKELSRSSSKLKISTRKTRAGSPVQLTWTGEVRPLDRIGFFKKKDRGGFQIYDWTLVAEADLLQLHAPDKPGNYEVRYLDGVSKKPLAVAKLKVHKIAPGMSGPESLMAGEDMEIKLTGPQVPRGRIAIYRKGGQEEKALAILTDLEQSPLIFKSPTLSGAFELRYETGMTQQVLARHSLNLKAPEVSLTFPRQVGAGSLLTVQFEGPAAEGDTIAIMSPGKNGKKHRFERVLETSGKLELLAPDKPGSYLVRYLNGASGETLKELGFRATAVKAMVKGPEKLKAGSDLDVLWSGPGGPGDIIGVYGRNEQGQLTLISYTSKLTPSQVSFLAPDFPGSYRLRYVTGQSKRILAETRLRVTDVKAKVSAKKYVAGGKDFEVTYSGPKNRLDVIALYDYENPERPERVAFKPVGHTASVFLSAPAKPGLYEVRYLLGKSQRTLAKTWVRIRKKP